jgi:hypothetical protein
MADTRPARRVGVNHRNAVAPFALQLRYQRRKLNGVPTPAFLATIFSFVSRPAAVQWRTRAVYRVFPPSSSKVRITVMNGFGDSSFV